MTKHDAEWNAAPSAVTERRNGRSDARQDRLKRLTVLFRRRQLPHNS
jgi:hypothetical protein